MTTGVRSIAIYGLNYWPERTGIGPYTTELAQHLSSSGHKVRVISAFPHYPQWSVVNADARTWRRTDRIEDIPVTRLWTKVPGRMTGLTRMLFECTYLVSALVTGPGSADTVVGIIPGLGSGLAAALHGTLRRRRVVMVVQDLAGQGLKQSGMSSARILGALAQAAERLALRRAHRVIAISDAFVQPLVSTGVAPERISVLPNWVRSGSTAGGLDAPSPAPINLTNHAPVLLHAGSMGLKQGLDQVVNVARLAFERGLNWRFLMVGDGSERARLQSLAHGLTNMEFRDPVPDEEFATLLASADVLLLVQAPSNIDMSFPSKLASYFASRRPVLAIVPPNGAVATVFAVTSPGFAVVPGDNVAVVDALAAMLDDPAACAQMVERGAAHARQFWSRDALVPKWAAALLGDAPDERLHNVVQPCV